MATTNQLAGITVHVLDDRRVAASFLTCSIRDIGRQSIDSLDVGNLEVPSFEREIRPVLRWFHWANHDGCTPRLGNNRRLCRSYAGRVTKQRSDDVL